MRKIKHSGMGAVIALLICVFSTQALADYTYRRSYSRYDCLSCDRMNAIRKRSEVNARLSEMRIRRDTAIVRSRAFYSSPTRGYKRRFR